MPSLDEEKLDEGFLEFSTTLEHGLQLHYAYLETLDGRYELEHVSPELKSILAHYMQAAVLWCADESDV